MQIKRDREIKVQIDRVPRGLVRKAIEDTARRVR